MSALILLVVGVCALIFGAPLLIGSILEALGFGAAGPIAGSFAAWIQSWIGNVTAGSLFATLQSIAMGAKIPVIVKVVWGAIVGAVALVLAALGLR